MKPQQSLKPAWPAPSGFSLADFRFARASLAFTGGATLNQTPHPQGEAPRTGLRGSGDRLGLGKAPA